MNHDLSLSPTNLLRLAHPWRQDGHCDFFGNEEGHKGLVVGVSENKLQDMFTGWKLKARFGLPCTEMNVLLIGRDRFIRLNRLVDIN